MRVREIQPAWTPVQIPAGDLAPRLAEVSIANLDLESSRLEELKKLLAADELARAERFHFEQDRRRFIAGRGLLRQALASYCDTPPEFLRFGYSSYGKPFLVSYPGLHFNLSHADAVVVVAVSTSHRVGIDVEPLPQDATVDSVAGLVFSDPELAALHRVGGMLRRRLFARLWTRKEAYIKADGRGVSLPLREIDVETLTDRALTLRPASRQWSACRRWTLHTLPVNTRYICSLAVQA